MALKDIFNMAKANRYTQDGRDELIKAQEAITEDIRYKPGDISKATGLQKQPDGSWAPVKNAPAKGAKQTAKKETSGASGSPLPKQTPEEIAEIGRAGREFREGLKRDAKERQAEAQKALAEQMKKEANSTDIKIRGMDKDNYIFNTMMERHIPREKAEESWNQEVERVKKLRAESAPTESDRLDAEVGLHEGEENLPDFLKGYSILSEEHDQDARTANAKIYPSLQPLVRQREPFMKKRIEAFTKLRDNPSNPKARADFVDASNAISQIDADIDRAYKKATGDSAPRILTGDCKVRIKKSK